MHFRQAHGNPVGWVWTTRHTQDACDLLPLIRAEWLVLHLRQHFHALGPQSQSGHIMNRVTLNWTSTRNWTNTSVRNGQICKAVLSFFLEMSIFANPKYPGKAVPGPYLQVCDPILYPGWAMGDAPAPAFLQNLSAISVWNDGNAYRSIGFKVNPTPWDKLSCKISPLQKTWPAFPLHPSFHFPSLTFHGWPI